MNLSEESLTQALLDEAKPLLEKHWKEIAHYQDIPLNPAYDLYLTMARLNMLRVYIARDNDGVMAGYAVYMVRPNLHYKSCVTATEDILYADPSRRGFGLFFLKWCDEQLKKLGVQVVTHHVKFSHDWSAALINLGYEKTDMQLSKRLDR